MATVVSEASGNRRQSGKRKRKPSLHDSPKPSENVLLCSRCEQELPLYRQKVYGGSGICPLCEEERARAAERWHCSDCGEPISFGEHVNGDICRRCDPEQSGYQPKGQVPRSIELHPIIDFGQNRAWVMAGSAPVGAAVRWAWGIEAYSIDAAIYLPCELIVDEPDRNLASREEAFDRALFTLRAWAQEHGWTKQEQVRIELHRETVCPDSETPPPASLAAAYRESHPRGRTPAAELPSLASAGRRRTAEAQRVADPSYVPTVDEALRNPAEFVAGMRETSGLSTVTPSGIAALDPEAVHPKAEPRAMGHHGRRKPAGWINEGNPRYRLVIDPEFRDACRALSEDERRLLRENIQKLGCLQPLIAWWDGKQLLLVDGHHRWAICQELDIWVTIQTSDFTDRAEVLRWIREHQAGRRNMTPDELQKMLAEDYAAELASRKEAKRQRGTQKEETIPQALKRLNAEAAAEENGAHREPRKATEGKKDPRLNESGVYVKGFKRVSVPFAKSHRCEATFGLIERADGTWVYDYDYRHRLGGGGGPARASGKGFPDCETCLCAAAKWLAEMATKDQDPRCWPKGAINAILKWQASLPQPQKPARAKKAAEVVAEKHGVSPATVKRAAKSQRGKKRVAAAGDSGEQWTREEIEAVSTLSGEEYQRALRGGQNSLHQAARQAAEKAKAKKVNLRTGSEIDARKEATKHIERYLDTMDEADAWQASDYLLDALNQWRGRHKPRTTKAARITRRKPR